MPILGLGTWQLTGETGVEAVRTALGLGFTLIDTAEMYGNQKEIGKAIADTDRNSLFITSKVWHSHLHHDDVLSACDRTLKELGTDHLDLYLVHWPNAAVPMEETFQALKELVDAGKVKNVGVANFTVERLKKARDIAKIPITVNQVEYHPFLQQRKLLAYCEEHDIALTAYSPLARGKVLHDGTLLRIGKKHGVDAAQVTLAWLRQRGIIAIPKASSEAHLQDNLASLSVELDDADMEAIAVLDAHDRLVRPGFAEFD